MELFKGLVFVIRHAGGQPEVSCQLPNEAAADVFGVGGREFAKFALNGSLWLVNRRFDFELDSPKHGCLRFISFPCECGFLGSLPTHSGSGTDVTSFNVVFVCDSRLLDDRTAEMFWQALSTLSRALIAEERRAMYISQEVSKLKASGEAHDSSLLRTLKQTYEGIKFSASASLYVNGCIHVHLSVRPFSEAPDPPGKNEAILLKYDPQAKRFGGDAKEALQVQLPVDSASIVRRLIDAADPQKTLKDNMIDLGLPLSTIQRVTQHLVYWGKAKIIHPLLPETKLGISPEIFAKSDDIKNFKAEFDYRFGDFFFEVLSCFSDIPSVAELKEKFPSFCSPVASRSIEVLTWLLERSLICYQAQFVYYSTHFLEKTHMFFTKPLGLIPLSLEARLPEQIKRRFSQPEMYGIFSKLAADDSKTDLTLRFICEYVMTSSDLWTAQTELVEAGVCSNEEFRKLLDHVRSLEDPFLVDFECLTH